jgi:hypothetical protein
VADVPDERLPRLDPDRVFERRPPGRIRPTVFALILPVDGFASSSGPV